jgi:hypothetical protein
MSWNVSDVTCGLRLTPKRDQEEWRSLGNSVFRPPSIGPDGVRTSLKPDSRKAFILHRAATRSDEAASKWQARLRIGR